MNLLVNKPLFYDGRFPFYGLPFEIGHFSVGSNREFCNDSSQLKYIVMPENTDDVFMDLNAGYSNAIRKDNNSGEKLDLMLKWIMHHQEDIKKHFCDHHSDLYKLNIDFVCYRGMLTGICGTIYENQDDWIICATKFKSVIYLCGFKTEQQKIKIANMSEREKLMTSWGYKFEQYMTADDAHSRPNTAVPVNEKEEFNSVMKGKLKDYNILFSAEVDGIDPNYFNRSTQVPNSVSKFKLIKWWLQSFLAGISRVICGFRDDHGIVRKVESFRVQDLPNISHGVWSASACLNFCTQFLDYVKKNALKDDPRVVYKFYWKPGSDITCEELNDPKEYQFLPDWYTEKVTF